MAQKDGEPMTWATKPRHTDREHPQREKPEDEALTRHKDCAIGMKRLKEIYRGRSDEAHC
jgi:hypothetical protein